MAVLFSLYVCWWHGVLFLLFASLLFYYSVLCCFIIVGFILFTSLQYILASSLVFQDLKSSQLSGLSILT
jgi:hypothetical protein